jgi:pectate lyase
VTYYDNWFDGTQQRNPRVRFGNVVHVLNNYYGSVDDYGVASTQNGAVLVEGNSFENTESPCELGQGDSPAGRCGPSTTCSPAPVRARPAAASATRRTPTRRRTRTT